MNALLCIITRSFLIFLFISGCQAQSDSPENIDRTPIAAGKFYPSTKEELSNLMDGYFSRASKLLSDDPLALIVPHAGYVYSGFVAASTYKQIDRTKSFKHIFVIGSSHTMYFNGASVYTQGDFITPMGRVQVDALASVLVKNNSFLNDDMQPHLSEHSLEVQLPFLQYWLTNPFTIVPIIIGGESKETCKKLAKLLEPYFSEENLFIISTDFSHYPAYNDAVNSDRKIADAVMENSVDKFLEIKAECENGSIPNEVTAMCGWTSVLTLLNITAGRTDIDYSEILYKNSGDSPSGEKDKVVGYFGIVASKKQSESTLGSVYVDDASRIELLHIARNTITEYLHTGSVPTVDESSLSPVLMISAAAFVTLRKDGDLRGCIGNFYSDVSLYRTVQDMAVAAATRDPRFPPVTSDEVPALDIEISVLTPMKRIDSINEIVLGRHGVYIKKGIHGGTFLPQVAIETGWTKEELLSHCAHDKAMLGWDGWKDADIYIYEAIVFSEHEFR